MIKRFGTIVEWLRGDSPRDRKPGRGLRPRNPEGLHSAGYHKGQTAHVSRGPSSAPNYPVWRVALACRTEAANRQLRSRHQHGRMSVGGDLGKG